MSTNYKLGTNKGRRRFWLCGSVLERIGMHCSVPYRRVDNPEGKQISLVRISEEDFTKGDRRVTNGLKNGKARPIIDLCDKSIGKIFGDVDRVQVELSDGFIVISAHHEDKKKSDREKSFRDNRAAGDLTHASLFTGGGISTDAIHTALDADGHIKAGAKWICEAELEYIEEAQQHCLAVTDETVILQGMVEEVEPHHFTPVNILSFSMPCAGFSKAGTVKHKQTAEEHSGTAVFGVVNAVRFSNPAVIISENVLEAKNSSIYALLKSELRRLGYKVFELELSNEHTGSIERRRRYWLVAISENLAPDAIELPAVEPNKKPIRSILRKVKESVWGENQYLKDKAIRDKAAGKGFANRQLLTGDETIVGTIGRHYAKRRSTEPFIVRDDGKERLLTPIEHAIVKSIPTRMVPDRGITLAHQILGQSVDYLQPFKLMRSVMSRIPQE